MYTQLGNTPKTLLFIFYSALPHSIPTYLHILNKLYFNKNSICLFYILGKLTDLLQEQEEERERKRLNLMKRGILIPQGSISKEKQSLGTFMNNNVIRDGSYQFHPVCCTSAPPPCTYIIYTMFVINNKTQTLKSMRVFFFA